jgi:(1->4)-alpha-D-glucan 1-alpha-D-glucosylmutase
MASVKEFRATYRVQLSAAFGFDHAAAIADYLSELGVSHLYCSPYFQAAPGSEHGYNVVDYHRVSDELGGAAGHARMCEALGRAAMGQVLDIVPNHMAITGPENPWWWDVLENGPSSNYAAYFDVDWDPPEARLRNTVLMPVLGEQYGRVLENGEIRLVRNGGDFNVRYHDKVFPVAPRSLTSILSAAAERCRNDDLAFIADALDWMPLPTATDRASLSRRHRDKRVLGRQLARLTAEQPEAAGAIDEVVAEINGNPDALDALLERQNYRLAFWRTASREIGYRRFFDINSLVALRMEDPQVFNDTHALVIGWLADGTLDGVRIDHVDGLRLPEHYLRRLRTLAPGAFIAVEKILAPGERLRDSWPVEGTTGYDFLNTAGGLFIDPAGEQPLTEFYARFTGERADYGAMVREKKLEVMRGALGSEINRLTAMFLDVCERHREHRDYTRHDVHGVLLEVIASFPVYRTYAGDGAEPAPDDVRYIEQAVAAAKAANPSLDPELVDFLGDLLLRRVGGEADRELVLRFQQVTGAVMAKAVEDTAFYCFNRMVCLNEVGGDPSRFSVAPAEFYEDCRDKQHRWPRTMLATSTHDTKRSEDVRARLSLLSEIPGAWARAVNRWARINEPHRTGGMPDRNAEYLFYQTVVGAWPIDSARAAAYMEKSAREAKVHTAWTSPNEQYEAALRNFVQGALADEVFIAELEKFVRPLIAPGRVNSLAQTLLKLTAPGIPDLYQGCELWDLSLVDPDNRRPVDFVLRRRLLADLAGASAETIMTRSDEGLPKMWVIRQALALRRRRPAAFCAGFEPLGVRGARRDCVVALLRGGAVAAIAPRLALSVGGRWRDTAVELPPGKWLNTLTGDTVNGATPKVKELWARFPVCLLERQEEPA